APEAERLEAHARECPDCAAALAEARTLDRGLDSLLAPMKPAPALEDRMIRSVHVIKAVDLSRRRWKRNLSYAVAASFGLGLAGFGATSLIRSEDLPFPGTPFAQLFDNTSMQETVPVLVAAQNLDQGTKLDQVATQFEIRSFPRELVPADSISDPAAIRGKA